MTKSFRPALGAVFVLMLSAGSVLAGAAVVSTDMTAREGPGDEFKPVWTVVAGMRVDVRECDVHQWCLVEYEGRPGWVHVRLATADSGNGGSDSADAGASGGGSVTGGDKGGSTTGGDHGPGGSGGGDSGGGRQSPTSGGGNFERAPPSASAATAPKPNNL